MTEQTITTDATAARQAQPELATVVVKATGGGDSATIARGAAKHSAETIRESLADTGGETASIRTVELTVDEADDVFDMNAEEPYLAQVELEIDCDLKAVEDIIVRASDAGGMVPRIEFQIQEGVRQQLQQDALADAIEQARGKAQALAEVEGLNVGAVQDVTSKEVSGSFDHFVDEGLDSHDAANFSPNPVTISEKVEVTFALTQP